MRDTKDEGTDISVPDASPFTLSSLSDACVVPTLTGQAVLDVMKPEYDATLTYFPALGGSSTPLKILVTYGNGTITCNPGHGGRPTSVALAVAARVVTGDGVLDESLDATVSLAGDASLTFAASEPVSAITGTYKPMLAGTWSSHQLEFDGTFWSLSEEAGVDASSVGRTGGLAAEMATGETSSEGQDLGNWE